MKKKIALVLIAALTVAALATGCSKKADDKATTTKKQETTTAKKEDPTTKKEEPTTEEPTTLPAGTINCSGWWVAHSEGYVVTEAGITVTCKATTNATASANWNTPIYVLYTADAANAEGDVVSNLAGYSEYFVMRSDLYGWSGAGILNADLVGKNTNDDVFKDLIAKENAPVNDEATPDVDEAATAWAAWLEANKAGVTVTVTAKIEGSNAIITMDNNGFKSTVTIPVDTTKTVYISLGGEMCLLENIEAK